MMLFLYWIAWSCALCVMVYINAAWLESRTSVTAPGVTRTTLTAEVSRHRNVGGDDGIDRHSVKTSDHLATTGHMPSTVIRKQFHVAAVLIMLPGLLTDINILRVAVSCSLVVLVMIEAGTHELFCIVEIPQLCKKGVCKLFMEIHLTATDCHLPYGITQCYLPPDTSENTPPLPQPDRLVLDLPTI